MARLMEKYHKEIVPQLAEKLGRKNKLRCKFIWRRRFFDQLDTTRPFHYF